MTSFAETDRLTAVHLKEDRPRARTPEIQQELDVAIFDLEEHFGADGAKTGRLEGRKTGQSKIF